MSASPDLSEFVKLSKPRKAQCQVGRARTELDASEQNQLDAACGADPGVITTGAIQQWLARREKDVSASAITSHRRRTCTCADA